MSTGIDDAGEPIKRFYGNSSEPFQDWRSNTLSKVQKCSISVIGCYRWRPYNKDVEQIIRKGETP